MKVLKLTLRRKWYDLIVSGEKTEEYRQMKWFWGVRLVSDKHFGDNVKFENYLAHVLNSPIADKISVPFKDFTHVHFFNGGHYGLSLPNAMFECKGITIGVPRPEWSDNAQGNHFIISLGKGWRYEQTTKRNTTKARANGFLYGV